MGKEVGIVVTGRVLESKPGATFIVQLDDAKTPTNVLGHLSGKMRQNFITVTPGDKVTLELSAYDLSKGRITRRERG